MSIEDEYNEQIKSIFKKIGYDINRIITQIQEDSIRNICSYFGIVLQKENFAYCVSLYSLYIGFVEKLYQNENSVDAESEALKLTGMALDLFHNNRLPNLKLVLDKKVKEE